MNKGLDPKEEFPFYGLLEAYSVELYSGDDEKRCAFAKRISETIKTYAVIDWIEKEDVQKEMRRGIKELLRAKNFPEDELELRFSW
jgi:2,3-bisphosphoglycerate-independent phosphoglycerate mutase